MSLLAGAPVPPDIQVCVVLFTQFCCVGIQEGEMSLQIGHTMSKLVILVLHFPKLRVMWTRDPDSTVQLVKALKV